VKCILSSRLISVNASLHSLPFECPPKMLLGFEASPNHQLVSEDREGISGRSDGRAAYGLERDTYDLFESRSQS